MLNPSRKKKEKKKKELEYTPMPNSLHREINSFSSIHSSPCGWQTLNIAIWFIALCISFPKKSMISGEYQSLLCKSLPK
jgi:hypothetical protein